MLWASTSLSSAVKVRVAHMGPPLQLPGEMQVHVVGWLEGLERDELEALEDWIEYMETRTKACVYFCRPARQRQVDAESGEVTYKFSCAGLVEQAYDHVGIRLVVGDADLPRLDLETLKRVWSALLSRLTGPQLERILAKFGLPLAEAPWPVLVPGYILHSLTQRRGDLPYQSAASDVAF
jgi:hypothetical protein